jgi:hypothetical protein
MSRAGGEIENEEWRRKKEVTIAGNSPFFTLHSSLEKEIHRHG